MARQPLQARGQVDRVADGRVVETLRAAKIADHRVTGGDPDADIDVGETLVGFA